MIALCPASVRKLFACDHSTGHIFHLILTKLAYNLDIYKISVPFENQPYRTIGLGVMAPEIAKMAGFSLVNTIEAIFIILFGQNLHTTYIVIRSRFLSKTSLIAQSVLELLPLEIAKIADFSLVNTIEATFII